jgi:hypothetical protein
MPFLFHRREYWVFEMATGMFLSIQIGVGESNPEWLTAMLILVNPGLLLLRFMMFLNHLEYVPPTTTIC